MSKESETVSGGSSSSAQPTVDGFEATLKDIVNGKRLSASKMSSLTEMALKLMQYDTQLVSVLYRNHKALSTKAKISSLYVFDSLCRAARSQVNKQGLTGSINSEKGNAATFLLKIEGVLDGLFQDVVATGLPEAKEKTKKVLDIWTKASTFPPDVLSRLTDQGNVVEKEIKQVSSNTKTTTTADPRKKHPTPPTVNTSTAPAPPPSASPVTATSTPDSAQAALLALLTSATAAAVGSQTAVNTSNVSGAPPINAGVHSQQPRIDPAKLLLHQLTNNVANAPPLHAVPQQVPFVPSPTYSLGPNIPGPSPHPLPNVTNHPSSEHRGSEFNGYNGPSDRGRERPAFHDNRRGGYRGGHSAQQGYGRDDFRSGRYEERDRYREEDNRGPYNGQRFSRSRSPPLRRKFEAPSGRRDVRPYSPPGRPSLASMGDNDRPREPAKRALPPKGAGKDEFGRDIRSPSVEASSVPAQRAPSEARQSADERSTWSRDRSPQSHRIPEKQPLESERKPMMAPTIKAGGLDSFDFSSFSPTDPACWKALGDAYTVTNGYLPSQEELMQYIMAQMMTMGMGMGMGSAGMPPQDPSDFDHGYPQSYGNVSQSGWEGSFSNTESWNAAPTNKQPDLLKETDDSRMAAASGGAGGHMRKVGDRWVFVKEGTQS